MKSVHITMELVMTNNMGRVWLINTFLRENLLPTTRVHGYNRTVELSGEDYEQTLSSLIAEALPSAHHTLHYQVSIA